MQSAIVGWWLSPRLRGFWENVRPFISRQRFFILIYLFIYFIYWKWRLQDQSTVAQRAETTVAEYALTSCVFARFRMGSYTMPGQRHSQSTPTSLGSKMCACLGVTCHLHFWQNDRGLLRATAVTRGWNGHPIRVSTQSWLWRRNFPAAPAGIRTRNLSITSPVLLPIN